MRRAVASVLGAVAGTTLLVGAKFGSSSVTTATTTGDVSSTATGIVGGAAGPMPGTSAHPGQSLAPGAPVPTTGPRGPGTPAPGTTTGPGTPPPTTPGSHPTTPPPTTPAGSGYTDGTFTGSGSEHWGTINVTLTISGGRITTVSANCSPCSGDSYTNSSQRNPLPKLISETLAAQSANIATVGGASETSKGFKSALSAALAKA